VFHNYLSPLWSSASCIYAARFMRGNNTHMHSHKHTHANAHKHTHTHTHTHTLLHQSQEHKGEVRRSARIALVEIISRVCDVFTHAFSLHPFICPSPSCFRRCQVLFSPRCSLEASLSSDIAAAEL
jgi:hypothetical protein